MPDKKELMQEMARAYEQGLEYIVVIGGPNDADLDDTPATIVSATALDYTLNLVREMNPDLKDEDMIKFVMSKSGNVEWRNVNDMFMYAKIKEILDNS